MFEFKNCGLLFTGNRPEQRLKNRFVWYKKRVIERQTYKTLFRDSGYSKDILQRTFYAILEQALKIKIIKREHFNLRMDATYFEKFCLICHQDNFDYYTQLIRFADNEDYQEMKEDLENLIKPGIQIESIITDGHKSILKAIKKAVPEAKVQRCLDHIQRMCLLWLTRYPKHIAGQELRTIVLKLLKIQTQNDKIFWIKEFN